MEEASAILDRLERIEQLRRACAPPEALLDELRALMVEAEAWSRLEGGEAAERAVERLRAAFACGAVATL